MNLQFWFEFGSTYSYPAAMRIEALAAQRGVAIAWRAFLLGPIFRKQGWNDSPFNLYPAKGRYMWRNLERICQVQGVPFRRPSQFPRNGLLAARVACTFSDAPWLPDFVRAVYRANFAEDSDISSPEVVARCLDSSGEAPAALRWSTRPNKALQLPRRRHPSGITSTAADRRKDSHRHGEASAPLRPRDADAARSRPAPCRRTASQNHRSTRLEAHRSRSTR